MPNQVTRQGAPIPPRWMHNRSLAARKNQPHWLSQTAEFPRGVRVGPRTQAHSRAPRPIWTSYLMACGLIGEPTALLMFNGGARNMNS
jgi:hypothetical protein